MCAVVSEKRGQADDGCCVQRVEKECTGCLACVAVCPNSAITQGSNDEEFYRPELDASRCTGCGACAGACHLMQTCERSALESAFAAQSVDVGELLESTSGGAFRALASSVVRHGGLVCGVVWDEEMRAVHSLTDSMETIRRMSGSKYVQSLIEESVYAGIGSALASGRRVLFSGLPCQVAAVKSYLAGSPENLLTVDFPCYGVPSPGFFAEQISDLKRKLKGRIVDFRFRDKRKNGFSHTTVVEFERPSGEVSSVTIDDYREIPYHHAFGKCDCFDMPCYDCRYASAERVSDITLDSFWGIEDVDPSFDAKTGVSMVLTNTRAGNRLWDSVMENFKFSQQDVQTVIEHNAGLVQGKELPPARKEVYAALRSRGFSYVARKFYRLSIPRRIYSRFPILVRIWRMLK